MTSGKDAGPADALPGGADTIVAQSTAAGYGALAIVRVSGPRAFAICSAVISPWPDRPRVATLSTLRDTNGALLDRALVTRFDAPQSFTGEDIVEIAAHGGLVVPPTIVAALVYEGARAAMPGEFTRRAFLNGKLDLLQAEATGDLIAATSLAAQRVALDQLDGGLTRRIMALREQLLHLEALLAYDIDFPEEDDGPIPRERIAQSLDAAIAGLDVLRATSRAGELVREGALTVLAGAPNVGKSSLFNALIGRRRAIVTEIPGTTRDALEAVIDIGRWPLRLVDTAGLRESSDPVERLGVDVARDYIEKAAVVLVCGDTLAGVSATAAAVGSASAVPVILVATKADVSSIDPSDLERARDAVGAVGVVSTSAEGGSGLGALLEMIATQLDSAAGVPSAEAPLLTRARHRHAVVHAHAELLMFRRALDEHLVPISIAAVHLRAAVTGLEDLIGLVDVEQILDEVFSRFCVGK